MPTQKGKTRVVIYARVSTKSKQDTQHQLRELRTYCAQMKYEIYQEYVDNESGGRGLGERQQFTQMFKDAHMRKFDLVLFWALDRFSREGMWKTITYLQKLDDYGVRFHSLTEEYINTDIEMVRNMLLSVLSDFAKLEREKISRRTKTALETARRRGKQLGTPPKDYLRPDIKELANQGLSKLAIARKLKVSKNTVKKYYPV